MVSRRVTRGWRWGATPEGEICPQISAIATNHSRRRELTAPLRGPELPSATEEAASLPPTHTLTAKNLPQSERDSYVSKTRNQPLPLGSELPSGSSDPQPCTRQQSCPPACSGTAAPGGMPPQRRAEGNTPYHATPCGQLVLGFSGTGEQLGGQVAQPGCSQGWAKGWLPSPSSAPHPEPGRSRPGTEPTGYFYPRHPCCLKLSAFFFFFPQPSPVPPWLRGDSNSNTPSAATT